MTKVFFDLETGGLTPNLTEVLKDILTPEAVSGKKPMEKTFCLYVANLIKQGKITNFEDVTMGYDCLNLIVKIDEPDDEGGYKNQTYHIRIKKV